MIANLGGWLEKKVGSSKQGIISQRFITGTLIVIVGAMGIIALDSGIRGNNDVLYTKTIIDTFCSVNIDYNTGDWGLIFCNSSYFI